MKTPLLLIIQFSFLISFSQTFERTYGGSYSETGTCIQHTVDGNYIISGIAASFSNGINDAYLLKINTAGNLLWSKTYGGTKDDRAYYVYPCNDGGYILTGLTYSFGSGGMDLFLTKTDSDGNHQWSTAVGGSTDDYGWYVIQTNDGGYVTAGASQSFSSTGTFDGFLLKTNSAGAVQWTKNFGGTGGDFFNAMARTNDGGFIVAGETATNSFGSSDLWLLKFNSNGDTLWTRQWGKPTEDAANAVIQTTDGGYFVAGDSHTFTNSGAHRSVLSKTDSNGNLVWSHVYGSFPGSEIAYNVLADSTGGCYILANTNYYGNGQKDFLMMHADNLGALLWSKTFGSTGDDDAWAFQRSSDGHFMVVGASTSYGAGQWDVYLVNTNYAGSSSCYVTTPDPMDTVPVFQNTSGTTIYSGGIVSPMNTIVTVANSLTNDPCLFIGVNENETSEVEVSVYPNPTSGKFRLSVNGERLSVNAVSIYNSLGEKVYSSTQQLSNSLTLDLTSQPNGIYFLQLKTENGIKVKKIIIDK